MTQENNQANEAIAIPVVENIATPAKTRKPRASKAQTSKAESTSKTRKPRASKPKVILCDSAKLKAESRTVDYFMVMANGHLAHLTTIYRLKSVATKSELAPNGDVLSLASYEIWRYVGLAEDGKTYPLAVTTKAGVQGLQVSFGGKELTLVDFGQINKIGSIPNQFASLLGCPDFSPVKGESLFSQFNKHFAPMVQEWRAWISAKSAVKAQATQTKATNNGGWTA